MENGSGNALRSISYQPVPDLCSWAVHSRASSFITDFDWGRMYGWVAYLGGDAAGYEAAETVAFRKLEKHQVTGNFSKTLRLLPN